MRRTTATLAAASGAAAVILGAAVTAAPASAGERVFTGCTPVADGRTYLSAFDDPHEYVAAPGGTFSGASAWTMSNASISAKENSPFDVTGAGAGGMGAASIGWTGKVTSPETCVQWHDDRLRFFYKTTAGMSFKVTTTARSMHGTSALTTWVTAPSTGWNLTPALPIPKFTDNTGTQLITIQIANPLSVNPITVDDVLVDPWRARGW